MNSWTCLACPRIKATVFAGSAHWRSGLLHPDLDDCAQQLVVGAKGGVLVAVADYDAVPEIAAVVACQQLGDLLGVSPFRDRRSVGELHAYMRTGLPNNLR